MAGLRVWFRFHGELNDFLPPNRRNVEFETLAGETDTLKHVIESLGVPHTEYGRIIVNRMSQAPSTSLLPGDRVEVYPKTEPVPLDEPRFVVDGHLGRLAAYLRMLGFDTWYARAADDTELATVAEQQGRVLLTRDVGLLKRRQVEAGYCVRSHKPHYQLREVLRRFGLRARFSPFARCMDCNGVLRTVSKEDVAHLLPPHTRETKQEFSRCQDCQKIFWRGSHYARMLGWIEDLTAP